MNKAVKLSKKEARQLFISGWGIRIKEGNAWGLESGFYVVPSKVDIPIRSSKFFNSELF